MNPRMAFSSLLFFWEPPPASPEGGYMRIVFQFGGQIKKRRGMPICAGAKLSKKRRHETCGYKYLIS